MLLCDRYFSHLVIHNFASHREVASILEGFWFDFVLWSVCDVDSFDRWWFLGGRVRLYARGLVSKWIYRIIIDVMGGFAIYFRRVLCWILDIGKFGCLPIVFLGIAIVLVILFIMFFWGIIDIFKHWVRLGWGWPWISSLVIILIISIVIISNLLFSSTWLFIYSFRKVWIVGIRSNALRLWDVGLFFLGFRAYRSFWFAAVYEIEFIIISRIIILRKLRGGLLLYLSDLLL